MRYYERVSLARLFQLCITSARSFIEYVLFEVLFKEHMKAQSMQVPVGARNMGFFGSNPTKIEQSFRTS